MSKEGWLIFRGKLVSDPSTIDPENLDNLEEVVEIIKGEMLSKSYFKLKESPLFHPNISYGDVLKVKPCDKSLSEKVTILEFTGIEHSEAEGIDTDQDIQNFGAENVGLSPNLVNLMKNFDAKIRPEVNDKFEQGLVFEPMNLVSHGSYKINICYDADKDDLGKMKDHFKNWNVYFQSSSAKNLGSVAFGLDTKFKKAVECLESAPWVKSCYLAFSPDDFPQIDFNPDLIPKNESEN